VRLRPAAKASVFSGQSHAQSFPHSRRSRGVRILSSPSSSSVLGDSICVHRSAIGLSSGSAGEQLVLQIPHAIAVCPVKDLFFSWDFNANRGSRAL
jgi:hypothetical protein